MGLSYREREKRLFLKLELRALTNPSELTKDLEIFKSLKEHNTVDKIKSSIESADELIKDFQENGLNIINNYYSPYKKEFKEALCTLTSMK